MNDSTQVSNNEVVLKEITKDTVREICNLSVLKEQSEFVAPNAVSIAEAYFSEHAWFRAIYHGKKPVGFLMLEVCPEKPEYFLWRFMIDSKYQRLGYGSKAIKLLIEHVKTMPDSSVLLTSVVQEEGGPENFYKNIGFVLTGEVDDGEAVMSLEL